MYISVCPSIFKLYFSVFLPNNCITMTLIHSFPGYPYSTAGWAVSLPLYMNAVMSHRESSQHKLGRLFHYLGILSLNFMPFAHLRLPGRA